MLLILFVFALITYVIVRIAELRQPRVVNGWNESQPSAGTDRRKRALLACRALVAVP